MQDLWASTRRGGKELSAQAEAFRQLVFTIVPWELVVELEDESELSPTVDVIEDIVERVALETVLAVFLSRLSVQERDVMESRLGIGRDDVETLDSIGIRYGVTRERIRQIEKRVTDRSELIFWTGVDWFVRAAVEQVSKRWLMGGTVAALICAEPIGTVGSMAHGLGVNRGVLQDMHALVTEMAHVATVEAGPFGEPLSGDRWNSLLCSHERGADGPGDEVEGDIHIGREAGAAETDTE